VSTEIEQPDLGSSVRLGSPIDGLDELEAGLSNKRRKTAESATASVMTRAQKISVQNAASGSNGSSAVSSASSVTHSGEGIDTPATTISTDSVGRGKTMLKTVTERLGGAEDSDSELTTRRSARLSRHCGFILDSEERAEERGEDSASESEEDVFQPSEDDSDEYTEIEEEISTSRRGVKGKAKARAAPIASSSTRTTFGGDSELSDVPDSEMELDDDEVEVGGAAAALPPPGMVRVPRHRGGRGLSRVSCHISFLFLYF